MFSKNFKRLHMLIKSLSFLGTRSSFFLSVPLCKTTRNNLTSIPIRYFEVMPKAIWKWHKHKVKSLKVTYRWLSFKCRVSTCTTTRYSGKQVVSERQELVQPSSWDTDVAYQKTVFVS